MKQIEGITNDYRQNFELAIQGFASIEIEIYYVDSQFAWFVDLNWTFPNGTPLKIQGKKIVTSTNVLAQFDETIPFGLAVLDPNGNDPTQLNSFVETHTLYLLDQDELQTAREI